MVTDLVSHEFDYLLKQLKEVSSILIIMMKYHNIMMHSKNFLRPKVFTNVDKFRNFLTELPMAYVLFS